METTKRFYQGNNRASILKLIRKSDGISRRDLSKLLGISIPSVTKHLESLMLEGYVYEDGQFGSTGGRRAKTLRYNFNSRCLLNIIYEDDSLYGYKTDLSGAILSEIFLTDIKTSLELKTGIAYIVSKIDSEKSILNISLPGVVKENVVFKSIRFPNLEGEDLKAYLGLEDYNHVLFHNDVDCKVYGELIDSNQRVDSCCYIYINEHGIGSAYYHQGTIIHGHHGYAGEIGYLIHDTKLEASHALKKSSHDYMMFVEILSNVIRNVLVVLDPEIIMVTGSHPHLRHDIQMSVREYLKFFTTLDYDLYFCQLSPLKHLTGMVEMALQYIDTL